MARHLLEEHSVGAKRYTDLVVWQVARELADRITRMTLDASFRREFDIVRQLRTSSNSICANIAEGFGRFSPADFARFLRIARGSAMEVQEHLHELKVRQMISAADAHELEVLCRRVLGAITPLIRYLDKTRIPNSGT